MNLIYVQVSPNVHGKATFSLQPTVVVEEATEFATEQTYDAQISPKFVHNFFQQSLFSCGEIMIQMHDKSEGAGTFREIIVATLGKFS